MTAPRKYKRVYSVGGGKDPNDPNQFGAIASSGIAATQLVSSVADAYDTGNSHGRQSGLTTGLKQGATYAGMGAKIGSAFGPEGALIGAGVGFVGGVASGLIGAHSAKIKEQAMDRADKARDWTTGLKMGDAQLASDPTLKFGNRDSENFAFGGDTNNINLFDGGKKIKRDTTTDIRIDSGFPAPGAAYWKDHPLITQHNDGSIRRWGEDTLSNHINGMLPNQIPIPLSNLSSLKPPIPVSDRAMGFSSNYYPAGQANSRTPDVIRKHGGVIAKHNLSADNAAFSDYSGNQIYNNGGDIHIKKSHEGKFTEYKARTGKTTEEALHSKDPHVRKMANFARNAAGWNHKAFGGKIGDNEPEAQAQQLPGGSTTPLSSTAVAINGNSHADGGVQLPGAEVEGGESISKNFVFSKQLGFADMHKPIARAIGKIEEKPMNPVRRKTLNILQGREQGLALSQEYLKQQLGIPSDFD